MLDSRLGTHLAAATILVSTTAFAAPGDIDTTFGTGGTVVYDLGSSGSEYLTDMTVDGSGRIILAAFTVAITPTHPQDLKLVRLLPSGGVDSTFASNGVFHYGGAITDEVTVLPGGKILVTGSLWHKLSLFRLTDAGALDTTFGSGGVTTNTDISFGMGSATQSTGQIVACGFDSGPSDIDLALTRTSADGAFDPTFGTSNVLLVSLAGDNYPGDVLVQPDDKIVVTAISGAGQDLTVVRLSPSGALDTTFGSGGVAIADIDPGVPDGVGGATLQSDGKILIASGSGGSLAVVRLTASGTLDPTFGSGGVTTTWIGPYATSASVVTPLPSGKVLAAGTYDNRNLVLVRYLADGSLDPTFGIGGITFLTDGGRVAAMALQADGKILVGGTLNDDLVITRFYGFDGLFADDFESGDLSAWSRQVRNLADEFNLFLQTRGLDGDYIECSFDAATDTYTYLGVQYAGANGGLGGTPIATLTDIYWKNESLASSVPPYDGQDADFDGWANSADADAFYDQVW